MIQTSATPTPNVAKRHHSGAGRRQATANAARRATPNATAPRSRARSSTCSRAGPAPKGALRAQSSGTACGAMRVNPSTLPGARSKPAIPSRSATTAPRLRARRSAGGDADSTRITTARRSPRAADAKATV